MFKLLILLLNIFSSLTIFSYENRKLFEAYIKPNAKLTKISDNSEEVNLKGFYAKILEVNPNLRDQFYIYGKDGKAKYLVEASHIVEIDEDIHLLPTESGNIFYPPKSTFKTKNKIFPFESELIFNVDELNLSLLNEFINSEVNTVTAPRYKLGIHFISLLPVNLGFNLNYQSSSWLDQNRINSQLTIVSIGPEFKFRLLENEPYNLGLLISYEFCPIYEISSDTEKDKFSAYLWDIGLQNEFNTPVGKINLGVDFRKHFLTYKSSTRTDHTLQPTEYAIPSLGVSVGYKIDWEL